MPTFNARVLLETAYIARWCAEAIELVPHNSGSTAIQETEPSRIAPVEGTLAAASCAFDPR